MKKAVKKSTASAAATNNEFVLVTFNVKPNASESELVREEATVWSARLAAPPVEGAANEELLRVVSKAWRVPKTQLELVRGHKSREKVVKVPAAVMQELEKEQKD